MASLHLAQEIFKLIYPVGSIYLSTSTTNPSTYFGGTWEQVAKESYLLGYNGNNTWFDQPGQYKGSKNGPGNWNTNNHALTIDQMPSHNHSFTKGVSGAYENVYIAARSTAGMTNQGSGYGLCAGYSSIDKTGGGQGHNHFHVSPYYIVVVWKRTA